MGSSYSSSSSCSSSSSICGPKGGVMIGGAKHSFESKFNRRLRAGFGKEEKRCHPTIRSPQSAIRNCVTPNPSPP